MKTNALAAAVYAASTVSALSIPRGLDMSTFEDIAGVVSDMADDFTKGLVHLVDLADIESFPTLSPEEAADQLKQTQGKTAAPQATTDSNTPASPQAPPTSQKIATCSNLKVRPEWHDMSDAARKKFLGAVQCLIKKPAQKASLGSHNRFTDLQAVHRSKSGSIHGVGQFLAWHRLFLIAYQELLGECGFTDPIPWWDETRDAGNFMHSPLFTSSYFGTAAAKTSSGQGTCVTDGAFANFQLYIGPGSANGQHCLARAINDGMSKAITSGFVNTCNSHTTFIDMQNCIYPGPHGYGHDAVGATMADVSSSPGDPVFFMHHGFVDRNYRIWQNADVNNRVYSNSSAAIGGTQQPNNAGSPTTVDYILDLDGLTKSRSIYEVLNTQYNGLCYKYSY